MGGLEFRSGVSRVQSGGSVTQLGYIGLGVSDLEAWRQFGSQVLGFHDSSSNEDDCVRFRIDRNSYRIWLSKAGKDDIEFVGWEVADLEGLERLSEQIRDAGVAVLEASNDEAAKRMVLGLFRFSDLDGLTHEVYCGPCQESKPFCSPCGTTGFKAGTLGLGHIVLNVKNVDESLEFFRRTLGVRVRDFVTVDAEAIGTKLTLAFASVNARHHSLALVKAPIIPGIPQKLLSHFMVEALAIDDVGNALQRFQSNGLHADQLGRHSNDHMISFYGTTPSGFQVEFGFGGRIIDDESGWVVQHYTAASLWGHGPAPCLDPPTM